MPTYQYRCTECGQDLEVVQKFSDASLTECPNCHGSLRKVYNAVGVVFKGSGFYSTDNRKNGSKGGTAADSGKSDSGSTESKSDSGKSDSGTSDAGKSDSAGSGSKKESSSSNGSSSSTAKTPAKVAGN